MCKTDQQMARHLMNVTGSRSVRKQVLSFCSKHIEDYKVGNADRLVQKFELLEDFGGVNYQIHQKAVKKPIN